MWTGHRPLWRGSKTGLTSSPVETQSHSAAGRIPLRKLWEYVNWDKLNKSTEKSLNKQDNGSIMELKLLGHRQDYSPEEIRQKEYFIEEWEREMLDE